MAEPLHSTPVPPGLVRGHGDQGARLLGYDPKPVQREVWALLDSFEDDEPLHQEAVVEVPRRAGKTTSLFALCVGRCSALEDYQVTYCAQTGAKSRERFYSMLRDLRRNDPGGAWRERQSRGEERIEWANGSVMRFLPPKASSFRGDAEDLVLLDEGQEVDAEDAEGLLGAILPVFDTRPNAQLVVAGTAGERRSGLLWDALESGRRGEWAILEYAAPDVDLADVDLDDEDLWVRAHPGIGTLTTLEVIRKRRRRMSDEMFAREYLGLWPRPAAAAGFSPEVWATRGVERAHRVPSRYGVGFDVAPDGSQAAVCAAWRASDGSARVQVLEDRPGASWVAPWLAKHARDRRVPGVGYDTAGTETLAVADELARLTRGRVQTRGLTTREFAAACSALAGAVTDGRLQHARQRSLDDAVRVATRRPILDGGWAWGRRGSQGSIAALVAATVALRVYDDLPPAPIRDVLTARPAS